MHTVTVRAPASTANLGPAFDCLGLALDLWNEASFSLEDDKLNVEIEGEGTDRLPRNSKNRIVSAFAAVYARVGQAMPSGLHLQANNRIPLSSGLGSSAAATLAGLLGANALLDSPLSQSELLQLGAEIEGHADNLAAALLGGLVLVYGQDGKFAVRALEHAPLNVVIALPDVQITTNQSRKALPKQVALRDAVANIGHSLLTVEALRTGDINLLAAAMQDQLHQPYRLPLIPGAAEAIAAAQAAGAAAALSGAGPSVIAFVEEGREKGVSEALRAPFGERGISSRLYLLRSTTEKASVGFMDN